MGIVAGLAAGSLAVGAAGVANNLANSGGGSQGGFSGGSAQPQAYIPQNQPGADTSYYNLANSMVGPSSSVPGYVVPQLQTATQNTVNNPYAGYGQGISNLAAAYGTGFAPPTGAVSPTAGQGTGSQTPTGMPGTPMQVPSGASGTTGGFDPSNPSTWASVGYSPTDVQGGSGHDFSASVNAFLAQGQAPAQAWQAATQLFQSQGLSQYVPNTAGTPAASGPAAPPQAAPQPAPLQPTGQPSVASMQQGGASTLYNLSQSAAGVAPQVIQSAFDPQNDLYNKLRQQNSDQVNATNSMSGVGNSPYGAGLADQSNQNFNLAWQNNQLQRELTGTQALGNLTNTANTGATGASNLGNAALTTLNTSGSQPFNTFNTQQGSVISALNSLSSGSLNAYGLSSQTLNDLATYLRLGQSGTSTASGIAGQNFGNNQAIGAGLGSSLNTLANLIPNTPPTYSYQSGSTDISQTPYSDVASAGYTPGAF